MFRRRQKERKFQIAEDGSLGSGGLVAVVCIVAVIAVAGIGFAVLGKKKKNGNK